MFVTASQKQQYAELGYAVLPEVLDPDMLQMLREECAYFVGYIDGSMKARGRETYGITHRGKRYFISNRYRQSSRLTDFLFGELMARVSSAFLGENVYLFNEQWVVKGPKQGMKFAWHQDSGYVNYRDPSSTHTPYLTCWAALDDMTEDNGTIFVLPHERGQTRNRVLPHRAEPVTNDLIGYEGEDPGELIEVRAGSIVVFSSTSLHRSTANSTPRSRRVYLAQYSSEVVYHSDGSIWAQAVPFIRNGKNIYDRQRDMAMVDGHPSTEPEQADV
jgi:ectoine hydroxylase-related dioxygenase (phytanoyl-CoA dioxygenase family)|tara:strand:- start:473 stop:1294 length:822 start_codon:yes stop_codon:yes gene_type:complete